MTSMSPDETTAATCATCRHHRVKINRDTQTLVVSCLRYPPTVVLVNGTPATVRPQVAPTDTCGEWDG